MLQQLNEEAESDDGLAAALSAFSAAAASSGAALSFGAEAAF